MHKIKPLLFALLEHLTEENNSHFQGAKRVFVKDEDTASSLTQFAYGLMRKGEESGFHSHKTMEEYFYFINGRGVFLIETESFGLRPTSFVRVPAGTLHNIRNEHEENLEFVYFGIAVQ